MSEELFEILIIALLITLNAMFSMSELAIVSAKKSRLQRSAENGNKGAARALELANNPNRFISTAEMGLTSIGIIIGAFGGVALSDDIKRILDKTGFVSPYSETVSVVIVVFFITFFSLILGELVPKRLALNYSERIASIVAPLMRILSKIASPIVSLLSLSTDIVIRVLGIHPPKEPSVTEDDLHSMLDQGTREGVFKEAEHDMVDRIFHMGTRSIGTLMTPRPDIIFLDVNAPQETTLETIANHAFARYPVIKNDHGNVIGIVHTRDLLLQHSGENSLNLQNALQQALFLPNTTTILSALARFNQTEQEMAIVIDEYGDVVGMVSLNDILGSITGDKQHIIFRAQTSGADRGEDGTWHLGGMTLMDDLKELLSIGEIRNMDSGSYKTLSGLVMTQMGRLPVCGDNFNWAGYHFEVTEMDDKRVRKVSAKLIQNG